MHVARRIEVELGASEDAATSFARDQLLLLRTADEQIARARVWRRARKGLLLGRFHRRDSRRAAGDAISRRLSGGRIVPAGPGIVCITLAVPVVDWLDPGGKALRPEQVLNRALRPLLAMLRDDGLASFYPGRDLVTVEPADRSNGGAKKIVAHASFTVLRDGVAVVEMQIAESASFAELPQLLDAEDPDGVAGVERDALAASATMEALGAAPRSDADWASRFAGFAATAFGCEAGDVVASEAAVPPGQERTLAHESAAADFLARPGGDGTTAEGTMSAATVAMLGVVECSAAMRGDRLTRFAISGDLIAPFHTLDDIACELEGEPFRPANVRKALARAMAKPRSFLLGLRELDDLILRMT